MKEPNEKKLKRLLDEQWEQDRKQGLPGKDDDTALYRLLFTALTDEPDALQNMDIAGSVVKQININKQKAESLRYYLAIASVVIGGLLSAYFAINYISPAYLKLALNFIETYKWVAIFIVLCFGIIEIADKNLVKRNLLRG